MEIIAHRGASAYAPENTLAAFQKAYDLGSKYIEFDVMLSADGEPFVIHDEILTRTTNGNGRVVDANSNYLKSLDAGKWFAKAFQNEKIPHLQDIIFWCNQMQMKANIELKPHPGQSVQIVTTVLPYIKQYWGHTHDMPLFSSFDFGTMRACRKYDTNLNLGLLCNTWSQKHFALANELNCDSMHFNLLRINAKRVQLIKERHYKVFVYTVNNKKNAIKLLDYGVDAIYSDYPDLMSHV